MTSTSEDPLEKLLLAKQERQRAEGAALDARKLEYQQRVRLLYERIRQWLEPLSKKGLLLINKRLMSLTEEFIGTYEIDQLDIQMGRERVSLIPRGALIIGAQGRVDLKTNAGKDAMLICSKSGNAEVAWEFVVPGPNRRAWPLTEASFKDELQRLIS